LEEVAYAGLFLMGNIAATLLVLVAQGRLLTLGFYASHF
jgi:hypothetical protein